MSIDEKLKSFPPGMSTGLPTIAIDFDGVIHDDYLGFHDGTIYGPPIKGSLEAIKLFPIANPAPPNVVDKDEFSILID